MKVSARNLLAGKVKEITVGPVNAEVIVEVGPGIEVVSVITAHSLKAMGLKKGTPVKAMIKASQVMLVTE